MAINRSNPDHPTTVPLGAEEIEAVKYARRGIIKAMQHLVSLTQHPNPSQARQAIELLFQYGLANRQQQYDFVTGQPIDAGNANISISLNKVELRLAEVMQNLPPELAFEAAAFIEKIENYAQGINLNIIDGELIEEIEQGPPCKCGCGGHTQKLKSHSGGKKRGEWADFIHGHHFKRSVTGPRIPPHEIMRMKAAGQWPPRDSSGELVYGTDKKKLSAAERKAKIKAKREQRIEDVAKRPQEDFL